MEISSKLEALKTNIIRWYNFKENSNILIVGNDINEIYSFLEKKHNVKMIDSNVNYMASTKFDYIIIKDKISYLTNFKYALAEDGTILLLMNNRLGVAYFTGIDGFETIYGNKYNYLSRLEIKEEIEKAGYTNYKFFYPLPNYEYANTIYSDEYLPKATDSKLANNNIYLRDNLLVFDEIELLRSFTEAGNFKDFTNSYLVEINPKSTEKAIFFNNVRKEKYRLITKIFDGEAQKEIYTDLSQEHLNNIKTNIEDLSNKGFNILDRFEDGKVKSKFVNYPNMYREIINKIKNGQKDDAVEFLKNQFEFIKEKFANDRTPEINKEYFEDIDISSLFCVKKAYIDLVFENMFLDNQTVYVYDQEWSIDNCPLEFILFRMIVNIYTMDGEVENILPISCLMENFGLQNYWDAFWKAETIFQNKVLDEEMVQIYHRKNTLRVTTEEILNARENTRMLGIYKAEEIKKGEYIQQLKRQIDILEEKLKYM